MYNNSERIKILLFSECGTVPNQKGMDSFKLCWNSIISNNKLLTKSSALPLKQAPSRLKLIVPHTNVLVRRWGSLPANSDLHPSNVN